MNRRNFLGNLIVAGASFHILPGSERVWVAKRGAITIDVFYTGELNKALHEFLMAVKANLTKMYLEEQ